MREIKNTKVYGTPEEQRSLERSMEMEIRIREAGESCESKKLRIAVFFGGCSPEYSVSLESAYAVICHLNREKYDLAPVGITEEGDWYFFRGDPKKIRKNTWRNPADCIPAAVSPNRGSRELLIFGEITERIRLDAAFPVMHGRFGEDGTLQGIIEMAGIPLAGCGLLASALCMDKDRAHRLAQAAGVRAPKARVFGQAYEEQELISFGRSISYPLYVKPVRAGSSYGVTRVSREAELLEAVKLAFRYDSQIILEENIEGFEVGCAVFGNQELTVGVPDEIELSQGFFDFKEKYTLQTSAIHVPARVSREMLNKIQETAKILYRVMDCSVFARVDLFLTPEGELVFNEINTIPGFTEHSRYPGMMKAAGIPFPSLLERIIGLAVEERSNL